MENKIISTEDQLILRANIEIVTNLLRKYEELRGNVLHDRDLSDRWDTTDIFERIEEKKGMKVEDMIALRKAFLNSEDRLFYLKRILESLVDDMEVCMEIQLHKDIYEGLEKIEESAKLLKKYI